MIPQELLLVPRMSVAENVFLGRESLGRFGLLRHSDMLESTRRLLRDVHSEYIDPEREVRGLPKADQQLVAIARRLLQGGKVFIMDEPTAALTERETQNLFAVVRKLCANGLSVVFISHRLEEVLEICDRITVLRDGRAITTLDRSRPVDKNTLIVHMIGMEIKEEFPSVEVERGKERLRVDDVSYHTNQGKLVRNISFTVHEGEVIGITGLVGVGKTELGQALLGLRRIAGGKVLLDGREVVFNSPVDAARAGFGYVSEDRRGEGLVLGMRSLYNMTINTLKRVSKGLVIHPKKERELGSRFATRLAMRSEFLEMEAQQLSGGNQQKVVIIRQIISACGIIIFDEPTKGIDVHAKSEVARLIGELSKEGKAILLLSSEPREVLGISDIVFVLTNDGLEGPFPRGCLEYEDLMAIEFGKTSKEPEGCDDEQ